MSKHTYYITPVFEANWGKTEVRHTEKGYSDLANRMFTIYERKYGKDRTESGLSVKVFEVDADLRFHSVCTYHA